MTTSMAPATAPIDFAARLRGLADFLDRHDLPAPKGAYLTDRGAVDVTAGTQKCVSEWAIALGTQAHRAHRRNPASGEDYVSYTTTGVLDAARVHVTCLDYAEAAVLAGCGCNARNLCESCYVTDGSPLQVPAAASA